MDHYGIGHAVQAAFRMYQQASRQTGRTTSLLESLKNGDRVICLTSKNATWLRDRAVEYGITDATFEVVSIEHIDRLYDHGSAKGRLIFDHSWVEAYYAQSLQNIAASIDRWQRELSGFGTAHIETKLAYREAAKWRL